MEDDSLSLEEAGESGIGVFGHFRPGICSRELFAMPVMLFSLPPIRLICLSLLCVFFSVPLPLLLSSHPSHCSLTRLAHPNPSLSLSSFNTFPISHTANLLSLSLFRSLCCFYSSEHKDIMLNTNSGI